MKIDVSNNEHTDTCEGQARLVSFGSSFTNNFGVLVVMAFRAAFGWGKASAPGRFDKRTPPAAVPRLSSAWRRPFFALDGLGRLLLNDPKA